MRTCALLALLAALAGCGGEASTGSFGDATLVLGARPAAVHAGIYLATARDYDEGYGVNLTVLPGRRDGAAALDRGEADLAILPPREVRGDLVGVMAVRQQPLLVLCVTRASLDDDRGKVRAVVRALQRGYTQAQLEPDAAVEAMVSQVPGVSRARLSREVDDVAASWTEGASFYGELPRGPRYDRSVAAPG